jgi:hypothetical protein
MSDELLERELDEVPFGRNRLLKVLGAGVFGLATRMVLRSEPALAVTPPYPCYGYNKCHNCYYEYCTEYCHYSSFEGCQSGTQCWQTCASNHYLYRCCDYEEKLPGGSTHPCICSGKYGLC